MCYSAQIVADSCGRIIDVAGHREFFSSSASHDDGGNDHRYAYP
jgi:hypothetical protein